MLLAFSPFCFQGFDHLYYHYSEFFAYFLIIYWTSMFLICSFTCIVFLCLFVIFLNLLCLSFPFPGFNVEFFLPFGFCPRKFGLVICVSFVWGDIVRRFYILPLMDKAEWGGNLVWWWFGLYFCSVCCLDEASCTRCYCWLGDARSCIQVIFLVWLLTIWYSLGLVLW